MPQRTILVFADQLHRSIGALRTADPATDTVLLVESEQKITGRPWHRQRLHLVLTALRRFAIELESEGFTVDHRRAATFTDAIAAHCRDHSPDVLVATEPNSRAAAALCARLDVELARSDQFLCHRDAFATWAGARKRLVMEDFYRERRRATGYLMDGDGAGAGPVGGVWNLDAENRLPLPKGDYDWPVPLRHELDALDHEVLASLPDGLPGADPEGWWPTSRAQARAQLDHVITHVLPGFGPYEDAMSARNWHLGHTLLSAPLNLGLLLPGEVLDRVDAAYRAGGVPLASAEGLVRQILGWREYVWGVYWWRGAEYARRNDLDAGAPLAPVYTEGVTEMHCVASVLRDVDDHGWTHHISAPHGARQPRAARGSEPAGIDGVDARAVRRRRRLGDGAERGRHGPARRRRRDGDEALRRGRRVHRSHVRLLHGLSLRPHEARRQRRVPVHHAVLGFPATPPGTAPAQPARCAAGAGVRPARRRGAHPREGIGDARRARCGQVLTQLPLVEVTAWLVDVFDDVPLVPLELLVEFVAVAEVVVPVVVPVPDVLAASLLVVPLDVPAAAVFVAEATVAVPLPWPTAMAPTSDPNDARVRAVSATRVFIPCLRRRFRRTSGASAAVPRRACSRRIRSACSSGVISFMSCSVPSRSGDPIIGGQP